jgi:hypothetical protein
VRTHAHIARASHCSQFTQRALAARSHTHARTRECIYTRARTQLSQASTGSWIVRQHRSRAHAHATPPQPRTQHNTRATHSLTCARTTLARRVPAPCLRTARTRCAAFAQHAARAPTQLLAAFANTCAPSVPGIICAQHTTAPRGMAALAQRQRHALRAHVCSRCTPNQAALRP